MKIILSTLSALLLVSLLTQQSYADTKSKVVTDEAELRKITDTYRSNPDRPKDFVPQGNGTVIDKHTGLQWMRCSLGQKWTGKTCEGESKQYTWEQANDQQINFAGYSDWRLPNRFELGALVYCEHNQSEPKKVIYDESLCKGNYKQPTIAQQIFPQTEIAYWSSSDDFGNDIAPFVFFFNGFTDSATKNTKMFVRLVRTPK